MFLICPPPLRVLQLLSHPSVSGSVMVVYLPSVGELAAIKQLGNMTPEKLTTVSLLAVLA